MTADQLPLSGTAVRRRRGIARTQLDRQLLAWRRDDRLAGDEHAAERAVLRDAAEAVDAARAALRDAQTFDHSPRTRSECARALAVTTQQLAQLLAQLGPQEGTSDDADSFGAFLAGLSAPAVRD